MSRYPQSITDRGEAIFAVPVPQFSRKFPAGRRSSPQAAPGGQPDPSTPDGQRPQWTRCTADDHLHLLAPTDVTLAVTGSHVHTLCGCRTHAEDLTLGGPSQALCMDCIAAGTNPGAGDSDDR